MSEKHAWIGAETAFRATGGAGKAGPHPEVHLMNHVKAKDIWLGLVSRIH